MRPARQRELVDDVRTSWQVSIRRACRNPCVGTSSYHNKSRRPAQADVAVDPPLFGDLDNAPDELVVHVDPTEVSPTVTDRLDTLRARLGLTTKPRMPFNSSLRSTTDQRMPPLSPSSHTFSAHSRRPSHIVKASCIRAPNTMYFNRTVLPLIRRVGSKPSRPWA